MPNKNARSLRKNQTDPEQILWSKLRKRQLGNFRFRRQHPIGHFIVDFFCFKASLVIELDGGQHYEDSNIIYDQKRTEWLESQSLSVIRFDNNEVFENLDGVLQTIYYHVSKS